MKLKRDYKSVIFVFVVILFFFGILYQDRLTNITSPSTWAGVALTDQSGEGDQLGDYFKNLFKSPKTPNKPKSAPKKEIKKAEKPTFSGSSVWKKPKKPQKKSTADMKVSPTVDATLSVSPVQTFSLGPGLDRETFLVNTNGSGTLTFTLQWTGAVSSLRLDVFPQNTPEKALNNSSAMNKNGNKLGALAIAFNTNKEIGIGDPEQINDTAGFTATITGKEGVSPLVHEVTLDTSLWKNLRVEVVKKSEQGEAQATLTIAGTGPSSALGASQITEIKKPQFTLPVPSAISSILLPVVSYELDRKASSQSSNISPAYIGNYHKFSKKMTDLSVSLGQPAFFNNQVIGFLNSAGGAALSAQKIQQIQKLMDAEVPPKSPINLTSNYTALMEGWTGAVMLSWNQPDKLAKGYKIEYAPRPANLTNLNQLQFEQIHQIDWIGGGNFSRKIGVPVQADQACYRIRSFNDSGNSGYSGITCLNYQIPTSQLKYNLKWMKLKAVAESAWDNWSNSDEPYLIFVMLNGKNSDGSLKIWSRRWTDADDVDSGETEPDGGAAANFTLFGKPVSGNSVQSNPQFIDPDHGLLVLTALFENDYASPDLYEAMIKGFVAESESVLSSYFNYDPGQIQSIMSNSFEAMLEFMSFGGMPTDDFLGAKARIWNMGEAWQRAPSGEAWSEILNFDAGNHGYYKVNLCLFPEGTPQSMVNTRCDHEL